MILSPSFLALCTTDFKNILIHNLFLRLFICNFTSLFGAVECLLRIDSLRYLFAIFGDAPAFIIVALFGGEARVDFARWNGNIETPHIQHISLSPAQ